MREVLRFYVGLCNAHHVRHVPRAFVSAMRLWHRRSAFEANDWIMDSGAFSVIEKHGGWPAEFSPAAYAARIRQFAPCGSLLAAVAQDYMCEPFMVAKTGLSVAEHQRLTVERYDALLAEDTAGVAIMPVLQGYRPREYVEHVRLYGDRLRPGAWVGVGSVCKRNASPAAVAAVLEAVARERPDLRLHGFGCKTTALADAAVRDRLFSADSMAWSFAGRHERGDAHDWRAALAFARRIEAQHVQGDLLGLCEAA